ncbi:MAG: hypothetical protein RLZZ118_573 [Bacteroidota bacterium]|jgi:hypothetical protein
MNSRKILLIIVIVHYSLFIANCTKAQGKYNYNWVTGGTFNYIINFDSTIARTKKFDTINHYLGFRGSHSCINDSTGKLIFMCNGAKLVNKYGRVLENGDTLINKNHFNYFGNGAIYQSQGSVIVLPFDSQIYKVFTPTVSDSLWSNIAEYDILYMHKVDMKANNDSGRVIEKKTIISDTNLLARVGMTACRHANGKDWWLVKQGGLANNIYTFFVSKDSIAAPLKQVFSSPIYNYADRSGQLCFNTQATKIANVQEQPNEVFVADFNRCDGQITNPKIYNIPALLIDSAVSDTALERLPRGLCFSPNGQYLYVIMRSKVFQLDLLEPDSAFAWYLVASIDTIWSQFQQYNQAQLGPDNKIYIGYWNGLSNAWSFISDPDIKGAGCNWCNRCLRFPDISVFSPPNTINYNLGASPTLCYPLDTGKLKIDSMQLYVSYQNISNQLTISIAKNIEKKLDVFSAQGALIYSQAINAGAVKVNVDASSWAKGVYIVRVGGQSKKVIIN